MNAEKIEELQHNSDLIKISNKKIDMDNARILGELQRSIDGLVKNRHKLSQNCIDSIIISARQLKIPQNIIGLSRQKRNANGRYTKKDNL